MGPAALGSLYAIGLDVVRVAIWLVLLGAVFVPLERLFADRRQPVLRRQFGADLAHYFVNSIATVAATGSLLAMLAALIYRIEPPALRSLASDLPLWARIPATMVVGELGFYWGHRLMHVVPLLWRFHAVHHSAEQVDWLTNTRAHPIDIALPLMLGLSLIYASGLAEGATGGAAVPLVAVVSLVWGFFIHANVKWRFGWLERVIVTPAFHRWHHVAGEHKDMNYAAMLPVFDYIFGTLYLPPQEMPDRYGCDTPVPSGWTGQLIHPFAAED